MGLASAQPSVTPFIGAFRSEQLGGINVERCIQDPTADMRGSSCFYLPRTVEQHRLLIEYHVSIDPSFEWEAPRRFISEATPETENGRLFTLTLDGNTLHLAYVVYRRPSHRFYESYWWIQDRVRRD